MTQNALSRVQGAHPRYSIVGELCYNIVCVAKSQPINSYAQLKYYVLISDNIYIPAFKIGLTVFIDVQNFIMTVKESKHPISCEAHLARKSLLTPTFFLQVILTCNGLQ